MFRFIFQTIILLYLILLIYSIIDIQKYNINGILKDIDNYGSIKDEIKNLNPIIIKYTHDFYPNNLPQRVIFNNSKLFKLLLFSSIKLLSINVKNVKKPNIKVNKNIIIMNMFLFKKVNIN